MPLPRIASVSEAPERGEIAIGHDILALISSAMYTEPLTVYRELVQNAADAVEEAVAQGLLDDKDGRVDITIDSLHRSIVLTDNGAGVSNDEFVKRMCSIGASRKRGTHARGFRGIGRLVGLGYCQELVFRSRSHGAERVMEATWDCRALREALRSTTISSLVDVVAGVVSIASRTADSDEKDHFFQVELRKVVRLANDGLLNAPLAEAYLSEVAPVPFHKTLSFGGAIASKLERSGGYCRLSIYVNGASEQLTRPYRDVINLSSNKSVTLREPTFFEIPDQDGGLGAVGWIAHHEYLGAFRRHLGVRGLRARVGNLQVGEEDCFESAYPEPRFNQWTIGEVHILDARVVPNGRRDYFEPNVHFEQLSNHIALQAKEIARRCRSLSSARRRERSVAELDVALSAYTKLLKRNRVARILRDELIEDVRAQMERTGRKVASREEWSRQTSRIESRLDVMSRVGKGEDGRANQRQMGQADVLRLLREKIPGGTATSVQLLKLLEETL